MDVDISARYIRIQRSGINVGRDALNLRELQIFTVDQTPTFKDENNNGIADCNEPECVDYISHLNNTNQFKSLHAEFQIESNEVIPANSNVEFTAGESINLLPNFDVKLGAIFHAYIENCQD